MGPPGPLELSAPVAAEQRQPRVVWLDLRGSDRAGVLAPAVPDEQVPRCADHLHAFAFRVGATAGSVRLLKARKALGWTKRCELARAFLWEHSYKRLELALLLGLLTCAQNSFHSSVPRLG
jgi:hypothetical protein